MNLPSAHSKVGASSMKRWANCPGSVALVATVPNVSSVYAEEGTAAHELAANLLLDSGATVTAPPEVMEAVQVYIDAVNAVRSPSDTLLIERGFHLKKLHPDLYGTADAVIWKPYSRELHVFDYKHGAGVAVEVTGNPQLRYYALGALMTCGFNWAREVTVHIVQPRCPHPDGPVRSETFAAFDLMEWAAELLDAVKRTEAPDAPLVPGAHCRETFCPAAAVCPALHKRTQEMAVLEFSPAQTYEPKTLAAALSFAAQAEAWAKAVREFAYAEAMRGRTPPGFKLVEKRANRKWTDEEAVTYRLGEAFGDEIYEPRKIKSPAQVEKFLGKKNFAEWRVDEFITKESSGFTLAPESDKRAPVRILDAATEFQSVPLPDAIEVTE